MQRLLRLLSRQIVRSPWRVILVFAVPSMALGCFALRTPIDLTFTGIMNRADPEVARYFEASGRFGLGGTLLVLVEGEDERLDAAAAELEQRLERAPNVTSAFSPLASDWLEAQAPWLVPRAMFDRWLRLVEAPQDLDNARAFAEGLEEIRRGPVLTRQAGARLLEVKMQRDPMSEDVGGAVFFEIAHTAREVAQRHGVTVGFSGLPALAAEDQSRTLRMVQLLSPVSLAVVLLLFRFVERRLSGLLAVAAPLLLAIVATVGTVGLLLGRLTVMETFFGVTVFGLGIDFAIHLLVRLREERARGFGLSRAIEQTLCGAGRGIVAGGATTAGAFLIAALAPDPVALHLGLAGGLGLLFCLVLMLTLLPALWVLLERRRQRRSFGRRASSRAAAGAQALEVPVLPSLARWSVRRPGVTLLVTAAVVALAACGLPRIRTETNLEKIINRDVPSLRNVERIQQLFGLNGAPWIVGVGSLEEARAVARRFEDDPRFVRAESLARLLPSDGTQRQDALERVAPLIAGRREMAQALRDSPLLGDPAAVDRYQQALDLLERAVQQGPPRLADLPASLTQQLIGDDGSFLVFAYATDPAADGAVARQQRLAAQAIAPDATALGALLEAMMVAERPWVPYVLGGILTFVVVVLLLDFKQWRHAVLALVPVLVGVTVTSGLLGWLGVSFNVMTSLVVPLILGLGVDDGIHVVHRMREEAGASPDRSAVAVGSAIVMTTLTTVASFGVLLLTNHPGLETMGMVMLIGLPICLLGSVTTLPALATVWLRPGGR